MPKRSKNLHFFFGFIEKNLTPKSAAEYAHVHLKTAERWFTGKQNPCKATEELLFLKATQRILPDHGQWEKVYASDKGLHMPCGRILNPNHFNHIDVCEQQIRTLERELLESHNELKKLRDMLTVNYNY